MDRDKGVMWITQLFEGAPLGKAWARDVSPLVDG